MKVVLHPVFFCHVTCTYDTSNKTIINISYDFRDEIPKIDASLMKEKPKSDRNHSSQSNYFRFFNIYLPK